METIRKNYLLLIQQFHPDRNRDASDPEFIRRCYADIEEAYRILGNAALRQEYDQQRRIMMHGYDSQPRCSYEQMVSDAIRLVDTAPDDAIQQMDRAVAQNPDRPEGYVVLGLAHMKKKEFRQAEQDFKRSLSRQKFQPVVYYYLGLCALELDDARSAVTKFRTALKLDPGNPLFASGLAAAYDRLSEFLKSGKIWEYLRIADPCNDLLWIRQRLNQGMKTTQRDGNFLGVMCAVGAILEHLLDCF